MDEKIEEITEKLLRGTVIKIDDIKYALLDYESFLIVSLGYYEMSFMPIWLKPRRGDVLVDIGAHIGKYAVTAAKLVGNEGMVVAIEPYAVNYHTLLRNIGLNKLQNVIALNFAAWDEDCELELFTGDTAGHHSAKINRRLGGFTVKARVMDHVLKELRVGWVDWIKIDVEGAECEVLYGLEETISKHKPKIIIEVFYENKSIITYTFYSSEGTMLHNSRTGFRVILEACTHTYYSLSVIRVRSGVLLWII